MTTTYYVVNETEQRVSQEVTRNMAEKIARALSEATGKTYTIRQTTTGVAVATIKAQS